MIMKKTLFLLLTLCMVSTTFSQFDYGKDVYSTTDMNINGKVKRITETHVYTNKKGKVDEGEERKKFVFEFDESGKLIKEEHFNLEDNDIEATYTYEYVNGKLNKVNIKEQYTEPYSRLFNYSSSAITVKNPSGRVKEVHSLSNGRAAEVKYFTNSETVYNYRNLYEYNSLGQIERRMYKDDGGGRSYSSYKKYGYNKRGDISKVEEYDNEGKLKNIDAYDFSYDKNKNWTKCTGVFSSPGDDDDDKIYELYTRTYEYY